MPYTPNNPYIPGDPYSYDLKWLVCRVKANSSILEGLDERIRKIVVSELDQHDPVYYPTAQALIESGQKAPSIAFIEGFNAAGDTGANLYYVTDDYNDIIGADFYLTMAEPNKWAIPLVLTPYVTPEMFGAYGDGTTDDTAGINVACKMGQTVVFSSDKTYLVDATASVKPQAGNYLLGNGATIQIATTDAGTYAAFFIDNADDVTLKGFEIIGDLPTHTGSTGEFGFGVRVRNSKNTVVEECSASHCWGDGFYCDRGTVDAVFRACKATYNRRQGMSVVDCDGLEITDCVFSYTGKGAASTPPAAGIDFEPFEATQKIQRVVVNNIFTEYNSSGILVYSKNADITINGAKDIGSTAAFQFASSGTTTYDTGAIILNNAVAIQTRNNALNIHKSKDVWPLIINGIDIIQGMALSGTTSKANSAVYFRDSSDGECGGVTIRGLRISGRHPNGNNPYYCPISSEATTNTDIEISIEHISDCYVPRLMTDNGTDGFSVSDPFNMLWYQSGTSLTIGNNFVSRLSRLDTASVDWTIDHLPNNTPLTIVNTSGYTCRLITSLNIVGIGTGTINVLNDTAIVIKRTNTQYYGYTMHI